MGEDWHVPAVPRLRGRCPGQETVSSAFGGGPLEELAGLRWYYAEMVEGAEEEKMVMESARRKMVARVSGGLVGVCSLW